MLGRVILKNEGFQQALCSVRFANNMMDKINLPIPGTQGPATYDHSILLFERNGYAADGTPIFDIQNRQRRATKKMEEGVGFRDRAKNAKWAKIRATVLIVLFGSWHSLTFWFH